jgi:hypothetical protein
MKKTIILTPVLSVIAIAILSSCAHEPVTSTTTTTRETTVTEPAATTTTTTHATTGY